MKTHEDELFNLIKSLSKNEKIAFKLFSKQYVGDLDYLKLYDSMDSLPHFDEKKIIRILKRDGKLDGLKDVKYNLQKVLIRFLQYYHHDDSVEIKLQNYLLTIEILFGKRLFSLAKKYLERADKLAIDNHRHLVIINLLSWKQKIMLATEDKSVFTKFNQEKYVSEKHYSDLYNKEMEYQNIKVQVIGLSANMGQILDDKRRSLLNGILKNPLLKNTKMTLSIPAKYNYLYILAMIHYLLNNVNKSYTYFRRTVLYFEQAKITPNERLAVLSRFIPLLCRLKKDNEIEKLKEEADVLIDTLPGKAQSKNLLNLHSTLMNNYIDYQLSVFNVMEATAASDRILVSIEQASPQGILVYYANRFLIYFLRSNYSQALHCINRALSMEKVVMRSDIIFDMDMLNLVVHYELGNEEILHNLCNSIIRKYLKELKEREMENCLLVFFGKTIHENSSKEKRMNAYIALRKELQEHKNQDRLNLFDFISWVDSKIENRSFLDILKDKIR